VLAKKYEPDGTYEELSLTKLKAERFCEIVGNYYENRDLIE
jgi:hypothetical protein